MSLLFWAGAKPRSAGSKLTEPDDPEYRQTAFELSAYHKDATMKRLKPTPEDNLIALLRCAAFAACKDSLCSLLGLGVQPNNKENGGSEAVDTCLWHIHVDGFRPWQERGNTSRWAIGGTLEALEILFQQGALWKPNDRLEMNSVRRILLGCEPDAVIDLLKILTADKACSDETLEELFSKRMREHMAEKQWWMELWLCWRERRTEFHA